MNILELIAGPPARPRAPKWLRRETVGLFLRGEELWWTTGSLSVRGAPPTGIGFVPSVVHVPADWGPSGEPEQVVPGPIIGNGTEDSLSFQRVGMAVDTDRLLVAHRDYKLLCTLSPRQFAAFRYPPTPDGNEQPIALFERVPNPFADESFISRDSALPPATPEDLVPFAFLSPFVERREDRVDPRAILYLPRMSGLEVADASGGR